MRIRGSRSWTPCLYLFSGSYTATAIRFSFPPSCMDVYLLAPGEIKSEHLLQSMVQWVAWALAGVQIPAEQALLSHTAQLGETEAGLARARHCYWVRNSFPTRLKTVSSPGQRQQPCSLVEPCFPPRVTQPRPGCCHSLGAFVSTNANIETCPKAKSNGKTKREESQADLCNP